MEKYVPKDVRKISVRKVSAEVARMIGEPQAGPRLMRETEKIVRYMAKLYRQDPYAFVNWLNRHDVLP